MLTFDAPTHTYRYRGEIVPGVTQILAPALDLSRIPVEVLERKREIGEAVHAATELDVQGNLDEDSIHEVVLPYFDGYRRFVNELKPKTIACEQMVYHPTYRYAGTIDWIVDIAGEVWLLDTKSSATMHPATALQTAAYMEAYCAERDLPRNMRRGGLHLTGDGNYRIHHYRSPMDFTVFLGLLNFHKWRQAA
jgi:hypothetical protein